TAISSGDEVAMKERILAGDSVNAEFEGHTPLRYAISAKQTRMVQILLRAGAQPNWAMQPGQESVLMLVSRLGLNDLVVAFIRSGMALDYADASGRTALTEAAMNGHLTTANVLINAGADVDIVFEGKSLLMHLVEQNSMLLVKPVIEAGADVNYVSNMGESSLSIAREQQLHELDLMLVQAGARL
ncbi:ankyrin repeat domain-containing protein, partial [Oleiphilus sp. HI0066]|uniref:ankyrin repeat domain-containing protein n=3 Tax=Oleiphilus TaxID=141450 RepID=UPI0007C40428